MKHSYFIIAAMLFMGTAAMAQPGNYLVNGTFEDDARGWIAVSGADATIDFSIESDAPISDSKSAKVEVTGTGAATFESSLFQNFTVHKDQEVEVSFKIKASAETFFNLEVCRSYPDFDPIIRSDANVVASANIPVGTDVQTITYTATPGYSDAFYKMAFLFGTTPAGVTIWIDDVEIRQTNGMWDGNILPNSEVDEIWATPEDFPEWKRAKLAYSVFPWVDGGWEGGYSDIGAFPSQNLFFAVDSTSKLSGQNSFVFNVANKPEAGGFWSAFNMIFFQAHEGEMYEFSVDVVASQNATFSVAMNVEPWPEVVPPDLFFLDLPATTTPQTFTIATNAPVGITQMHKIFFANLPAGSNYQLYIDNVRLRREGAADIIDSVDDLNGLSGIKIFPNPTANGTFNVDLTQSNIPTGKNMIIELYTIDGKLIHSQKQVSALSQIQVSNNLKTGVYVVRITCENNVFIQKLVQQ